MSFGAWIELLASGLITGGIYALVALGLKCIDCSNGIYLRFGCFYGFGGPKQFSEHLFVI